MSKIETPILDLTPQYESLKGEIATAIQRVLDGTHFIMGPDVKAFEDEVAAYLGVKHAIGVNSGTDALFIALRALGVGPGDEVVTTPFTFFATAEAIAHVGATPVFVDVEEESFNIDASMVEAAITPRTKAIIPVHLFGRPADMATLVDVARRHNLAIVEDCAQSFGARLDGKQSGTIGDFGAYSFFPSKNLGAYGDGGLLVTNRDDVAEVARMLRVHGSRKKYYNEIVGYNSRLDTLQAAILRVKLPHLDKWNEGRRRVATTYGELLAGAEGIVTPAVTPGHVFHQYTVRLTSADRDQVQQTLADAGIGTMVYYPVPQDRLPIFAGKHPPNPVSDRLASQVLSLPIWPELERDRIEEVCQALRAAVMAASKAPTA